MPHVGLVRRPEGFRTEFIPVKGDSVNVASQDNSDMLTKARVIRCRKDGSYDVQYRMNVTRVPEFSLRQRGPTRYELSYHGLVEVEKRYNRIETSIPHLHNITSPYSIQF